MFYGRSFCWAWFHQIHHTLPPFHHRDKLPPHQVCTAQSLSHCDQGNQFLISHLLKGTKQTSFEEHLKEKNKKLWGVLLKAEMDTLYSIFIHNNRYKIETFSTLVCPNLYSSWSTSMDPKSFSAAFLLSMNWPSGITLAFSTLYLLSIIRKTLFSPYNTYMKCVL